MASDEAMSDYLIQRQTTVTPNGATSLAWVDEEIIRDLKADQGKDAVTISAAKHPDHLRARRRAIKRDHIEEYEVGADPVVTKVSKG